MPRRELPAALLILISASAPALTATPALVFDARHAQFGDLYQGSTVEQRYTFTNTGETPVTVIDTFVVDGTGRVSVSPRSVPPGAGGVAVVRQPLANLLGRTAFRYALITDEPDVDRYRFTLSGFVQSAYDPETLTIDFDLVDRVEGATAEVELSSREVPALAVRPPVGLPQSIGIEILGRAGTAGQGQRLQATLPAGVAPGLVSGSFMLQTNVAHQPEVRVFYRANVIGDVVPSENPLQLGITRIGEVLLKEIQLESKTGRPFEVERIADSGDLFEWTVDPCVDGGDTCRRLVLRLEPETPLSLIGKLRVHLAGEADPVTLNYRGMVVTQGTVIKTIELPPPGTSDVRQ